MTTTPTTTTTAADPLEELRDAVHDIADARRRRDQAMRDARDAGATWRAIAAAANMTEHGVRYALLHAGEESMRERTGRMLESSAAYRERQGSS